MEREAIRRLLREQIGEVWGRGRVELVDRNYAETVVDHMPAPGQPPGRAALKQVVRDFRAAMPDLRFELHHVLACGDMGVDVWTLTGTHSGAIMRFAPTGAQVRFSGIDMVRVADGRIAELWHVEELLHFAHAIGAEAASFGAPAGAGPLPPTEDADYDPGRDARTPDPAGLTTRERRNLALGRVHIEELWAKGRFELAETIYAEGVVDRNPAPGQRPGIPGIVDVLTWLREAAPDLRMRIEQYVADGDLVADRWVMEGTHSGGPLMGLPARGRRFAMNGMDVSRFDDAGRITDVWHVEEFARLRAQIA